MKLKNFILGAFLLNITATFAATNTEEESKHTKPVMFINTIPHSDEEILESLKEIWVARIGLHEFEWIANNVPLPQVKKYFEWRNVILDKHQNAFVLALENACSNSSNEIDNKKFTEEYNKYFFAKDEVMEDRLP